MKPVLVEVKHWDVHICELGRTPDGETALDPAKTFEYLGRVEQSSALVDGLQKRVWRWYSDTSRGMEMTKRACIERMLASGGYVQAALTAAIPDLLSDLL
jgi:hypothetical protein